MTAKSGALVALSLLCCSAHASPVCVALVADDSAVYSVMKDGAAISAKASGRSGTPPPPSNVVELGEKDKKILDECIFETDCPGRVLTGVGMTQVSPERYAEPSARGYTVYRISTDVFAVVTPTRPKAAKIFTLSDGRLFNVPYVSATAIDASAKRLFYSECQSSGGCTIYVSDFYLQKRVSYASVPYLIEDLNFKDGEVWVLGYTSREVKGILGSFASAIGHPQSRERVFFGIVGRNGKLETSPLLAETRNMNGRFLMKWLEQPQGNDKM